MAARTATHPAQQTAKGARVAPQSARDSPGAAYAIDEPLAVREIGIGDLKTALRKGWADFMAKPSHIIFLGIIYPIVAVLLIQYSVQANLLPLFFPLLAGFALIGPFAGIGLYEISRRRELGLDTSWKHALGVFDSRAIRSIIGLGALLTLLFVIWLVVAMSIYDWLFAGMRPTSIGDFVSEILTTGRGWALIIIGHAVGFCFAVIALMLSVVSFPLLLDRHVRTIAAIRTSIRAVTTNPRTMAIWGMIIAGGLMAGSALLFGGLAIIIPVLAHASWHLYRRVVV